MMRKRQRSILLIFIILSFCALIVLISVVNYLFSPSYQSKKVVEAFYTHEQIGHFAESWELLHPYMKDRWSKEQFMADRYHVFIGHFGTDTFQFTIEENSEVKDWKMAEELQPFDVAYKFNVIQTYEGKYGKFSFLQEVYVVKEEEEWRILWDYN